MNKSRVLKTGNLLTFAEDRLIAKVKRGDIHSYSMFDIIDNAIKVRNYLDKHKRLIIPKLSKSEKIQDNRLRNKLRYIKIKWKHTFIKYIN